MHPRPPERLSKAQYFSGPQAPFRIFHQLLDDWCTLHWHEFYELTFVLAGTGHQVLNGITLPLAPGSFWLMTPADFHEIGPYSGQTLEMYNMIFAEEMIHPEVYKLLFPKKSPLVGQVANEAFRALRSDFEQIRSEAKQTRTGWERMVSGSLEKILITLIRSGHADHDRPHKAADSPRSAIRGTLAWLENHFREPLRLKDAAEQAGMSPNYFSGLFHEEVGVPFQTYLQTLRLEFANKMLKLSDIPVTEICYASGFNTLSHFERAFKYKYGMSPIMLRSSIER